MKFFKGTQASVVIAAKVLLYSQIWNCFWRNTAIHFSVVFVIQMM